MGIIAEGGMEGLNAAQSYRPLNILFELALFGSCRCSMAHPTQRRFTSSKYAWNSELHFGPQSFQHFLKSLSTACAQRYRIVDIEGFAPTAQ
jgi:hypothetical protein